MPFSNQDGILVQIEKRDRQVYQIVAVDSGKTVTTIAEEGEMFFDASGKPAYVDWGNILIKIFPDTDMEEFYDEVKRLSGQK